MRIVWTWRDIAVIWPSIISGEWPGVFTTSSKTLVLSEAGTQKQNILDKSNVTASEIIGFRSPQLSTAGDDQIDVLQKLGYKYDASYTYTRQPESGKNAWPFTADYPC
jgi:ABC-type molybdate transport system substrate-binding protein